MYDILVIGSGAAGLTAALTASEHSRVALVTGGNLSDGCTRWAQGGIAAAVGHDDSSELHFEDTMAAGRGLCDEAAVRVLVESAPACIEKLTQWGVHFDREEGGSFSRSMEAAHSRPRVLHARDATGLEMENALTERVRSTGVDIYENHAALSLHVTDDGRCCGVTVFDHVRRKTTALGARAVILATGGAGQLWRHTTNPESAAGDGVALAYDAGADVASMEFMQFHPTALAVPGAPRYLMSETVRGEGAHIVNDRGERFILNYDARGELAPRDVVSHAMWQEMERNHLPYTYLDCSPIADRVAQRFPTLYEACMRYGLDMSKDRIPVAPAAHYLIGGVRATVEGITSVPGLYACGEVASTGVHGANRLASNSLLEAVVCGGRAANTAAQGMSEGGEVKLVSSPYDVDTRKSDDLEGRRTALRDAMWSGAGIVRDATSLQQTLSVLETLTASNVQSVADRRFDMNVRVATLVSTAALAREESRGTHLRSDFPAMNDEKWQRVSVMNKTKGVRYDGQA